MTARSAPPRGLFRRGAPRLRRAERGALLAALALGASLGSCAAESEEPPLPPPNCDESPGELFERRVRPLLETDRPESCSECHAGGISLAEFAREDACESMACLIADGLVSLEDPEGSVLLSWIERAQGTGPLVTEQMVRQEYLGFRSWIEHEAACGQCREATCGDEPTEFCAIGSSPPNSFGLATDPGDCEQETLEALFRGTIYKDRDRCLPCHFVEEETAISDAPRFFTERGGCGVGSLASMRAILRRGLVNIKNPEQSFLLLKPLAESDGGMPHEGGDKFLKENDSHYRSFAHWVFRYSDCQTAAAK